MLGRRITDPEGIEGPAGSASGLGLLDLETTLSGEKVLKPVSGVLASAPAPFDGYEMHVGRTTGAALERPFLFIGNTADGAQSADGRIAGTYVHGLFARAEARGAVLKDLGAMSNATHHAGVVDALLDSLAQSFEKAVDIAALSAIAGLP